jgi:hypothetical protein
MEKKTAEKHELRTEPQPKHHTATLCRLQCSVNESARHGCATTSIKHVDCATYFDLTRTELQQSEPASAFVAAAMVRQPNPHGTAAKPCHEPRSNLLLSFNPTRTARTQNVAVHRSSEPSSTSTSARGVRPPNPHGTAAKLCHETRPFLLLSFDPTRTARARTKGEGEGKGEGKGTGKCEGKGEWKGEGKWKGKCERKGNII